MKRSIRLYFAAAFVAALTLHWAQSSNEPLSRIAFVNDINISVMNADGSGRRQLTAVSPGPASHPSWSPDSRQIAYDTVVSGPRSVHTDIFVIDVETHVSVDLTNQDSDDLFPIWSPQGDRIAFVSDRDGNWEIYLMDVNGQNQVNLTHDDANDGVHGLTWSSDGSGIAFVSDRDQGRSPITGNYQAENIYVIDVPADAARSEKSEVHNLTSQIDQCPAGEFYANPSWSADNQLAFSMTCGLIWDIYLLPIDTVEHLGGDSEYINLTRRPNADGVLGLSWSPDAKKIIFVSNPDTDVPDSQEIYILNVPETLEQDQPAIEQITDNPAVRNFYAFPVWESARPATHNSG